MGNGTADGLKAFFPGAPREWVERLVESNTDTDDLTERGNLSIVISDDGETSKVPITVTKSAAPGIWPNLNPPVIEVVLDHDASGGDPGIIIRNNDSSRLFNLRPNAIVFVSKLNTPSPGSAYFIGVQTRDASDDQDGGNLNISAGTSQGAGNAGGTLNLKAGYGDGGNSNGKVTVGSSNTSVVEVGAADIPTDIKGELTIGGIKFLVVTADPNGSVTAPKGSIATDTTNATLHQNTDGGTTWVAR